MWAVQAVTEPPVTVLAMQHGQVLITRQDTKVLPLEPEAKVVGHAKTVELCRQTDTTSPDPWLQQDPWSKAISLTPVAPAAQPAPNVLHELEQLPTEKMEVDDQDQRLQQLESQVQQLTSKQAAMECTIHEHHQQSTAQVQTLQQQMKMQLDMQTQHMSTMLTDQMSRIEAILAKKPRTE